MAHPLTGWYLFWLGLATGAAWLAMSAYRFVSPRWLKWLLWASGLLVMSRYLTMAILATSAQPPVWWLLRRLWFASVVGLTFPGVVALDQLVRHPAMTPKKLLIRFSPFLLAYALVLLLGRIELESHPVIGMRPRLVGWAVGVLACAHTAFILVMLGLGFLLAKKLPSPPIRLALAGLMAAYAYLGADGVLLAVGRWYPWPFLYSEILALVALWLAFDTAKQHPL